MATAKQIRTELVVEEQLDVCKRLKKGATVTSLSTEFRTGKSTISNIKQMKKS